MIDDFKQLFRMIDHFKQTLYKTYNKRNTLKSKTTKMLKELVISKIDLNTERFLDDEFSSVLTDNISSKNYSSYKLA